jgi:hypothetical protein
MKDHVVDEIETMMGLMGLMGFMLFFRSLCYSKLFSSDRILSACRQRFIS